MRAESLSADAQIVVAGAGAIGVYVGGKALAEGRRVAFLGRDRFVAAARSGGVTVLDPDGLKAHTPASEVDANSDPAILSGADVILVAVRSNDTDEMAALIRANANPNATVVSLQNGVRNKARLVDALAGWDVRGGMVPYNVVLEGPATAKRATTGATVVETGPRSGLAALLDAPGAPAREVADIAPIQWGKLLLNLNNALNALSGLPLVEQLGDPQWRRVLADNQTEALGLLKRAGLRPTSAVKGAPPTLMPHILRLPTPLFRRIAAAMFRIAPDARSSMQTHLEKRQTTEIDDLQGEIVRLAETLGLDAPISRRVVAAISAAEAAQQGPPRLSPETLKGA